MQEFAKNGYQAASTAAIARRAGISQPYIYALFPSKLDLFLGVHDRVIDGIRAAFVEAARAGNTPQEKLDAMGAVYPMLIADRYVLLAQLQGYSTGDSVIQAHASRRYRELFEDVVRLTGAARPVVALFFACGMLANITTALGLEDIFASVTELDTLFALEPSGSTAG